MNPPLRPHLRLLVAVIALLPLLLCLAFLALSQLQQPAYSEGIPSVQAQGNASITETPTPTPTPTPCPTNPAYRKKGQDRRR